MTKKRQAKPKPKPVIKEEWVKLKVIKILHETKTAFQFLLKQNHSYWWCPKDRVQNPENYKKGHKYVIVTVTAWLATEWELEEDGSDEDRTPAGK